MTERLEAAADARGGLLVEPKVKSKPDIFSTSSFLNMKIVCAISMLNCERKSPPSSPPRPFQTSQNINARLQAKRALQW